MTESIPVYLDTTHPLDERVRDLIGRLTLDEKIGLMSYTANAVPRLGIPAYSYWSEGLHGVARNGRATVFPQAIGLAAGWDPDLIRRIGSAIGDEGRAKYQAAFKRKGSTGVYQGLNFWSPNINIYRDPRWGRGQETYGEDPILTGELGAAYVRGLQGDDPRYMKAGACAKHYAVHSGPEALRHEFNVDPSPRDLYDTYLPAFKKLVREAQVESVMGAYNAVFGVPCNASRFLLEEVLRSDWGFEGHVVSDCGAVTDIHLNHHYATDAVEGAAAAIQAGCDLACDHAYSENLAAALERGLLSEADLDRSLERTLRTRFKLGMFDPAEQVPFNSIEMSVVDCVEHRRLAYEAALKSIVLLKNDRQVLPISPNTASILVTGPNAAALNPLLGNYYGFNDHMVTALEGITAALPEGMGMEYHPGTQLTDNGTTPHNWSIGMSAAAELTIACMGLSPYLEGEEGEALLAANGGDRPEIELPAAQVNFLRSLNQAGARIILVLFGGGPIALGEVEQMVEAVLHVWYPGEEGGHAIADVLFGRANPSGKLPVTFPQATSQLPPFEDYSMRERTYRYATWTPLYPFGFGLSYTRFSYAGLTLDRAEVDQGEPVEFAVTVTNRGEREGEEVVQVYLSDLDASGVVPFQKLVAFQRVGLKAGESRVLHFTLAPDALAYIDEAGRPVTEPGVFRLTVGGCSPVARGLELGAPQPVSAAFTLRTAP